MVCMQGSRSGVPARFQAAPRTSFARSSAPCRWMTSAATSPSVASERVWQAASRRRDQDIDCLFKIGTANSNQREAIVGTTRPSCPNRRSAMPNIAAARTVAGGRTESRFDSGYRELPRQYRPTPPAAKLLLAPQSLRSSSAQNVFTPLLERCRVQSRGLSAKPAAPPDACRCPASATRQ